MVTLARSATASASRYFPAALNSREFGQYPVLALARSVREVTGPPWAFSPDLPRCPRGWRGFSLGSRVAVPVLDREVHLGVLAHDQGAGKRRAVGRQGLTKPRRQRSDRRQQRHAASLLPSVSGGPETGGTGGASSAARLRYLFRPTFALSGNQAFWSSPISLPLNVFRPRIVTRP